MDFIQEKWQGKDIPHDVSSEYQDPEILLPIAMQKNHNSSSYYWLAELLR